MADADNIVAWYKGLSDEIKNYWTFRWIKMQDPAYEVIYGVMKDAEKVCKLVKSFRKKENHGRPESV